MGASQQQGTHCFGQGLTRVPTRLQRCSSDSVSRLGASLFRAGRRGDGGREEGLGVSGVWRTVEGRGHPELKSRLSPGLSRAEGAAGLPLLCSGPLLLECILRANTPPKDPHK